MRSTSLPPSRAGNIVRLLSIVTLCLAVLASLAGARRVAAVQPWQAVTGNGSGLERRQPSGAPARLRPQAAEKALAPSDRARLLFAELVFGATILAAPLRWLGRLLAPPASRRKRVGFPWGRLASAVALLASVLGLAEVFVLARYPSLLRRGFLGPLDTPVSPLSRLHVPLALTACVLLLAPANLAYWRQERPTLRRLVGDSLVTAAALVLLALLWG